MNKKTSLPARLAGLTIGLLASTQLHATTIGFDDVHPNGAMQEITATEPVMSEGYVARSGDGQAWLIAANGDSNGGFAGNGTDRVSVFNNDTLTIAQKDGALFDLFSFDGGESWTNSPGFWANLIQVVGLLADGSTVSASFALDGNADSENGLQLFTLGTAFKGLRSVAFSGIGGNGEFTIDNIAVAGPRGDVPEPATLGLLAIGAVGWAARRKARAVTAAG